MPSASVKSDSSGSVDTQDPLGKVFVLIEKKIRNLEKRKNKLENYKVELVEGKKLNDDQQRAVDAFDAVVASLELCRELSVQIGNVMAENLKMAKLQQKKHQEEKAQQEFDKIKQVLKVQDTLAKLKQKNIRADFLTGRNGAIQVNEDKMRQLDELTKLVTPPTGSDREPTFSGFKGQINAAAENLLSLLEGRNKPAVSGTTYRDMKTLIYQIANSPYPKKPRPTAPTQAPQVSHTPSPLPDQGADAATSQTTQTKNKKNSKQTKNMTTTTAVNGNTEEARGKTAPDKKGGAAAPPAAVPPSAIVQSVPAGPAPPTNPVVPNKSTSVSHPTAGGKTKRRNEVPQVEAPPPGIASTGVPTVATPELISAATLPPPVRLPTIGHAHTYMGGARLQMDINELVPASSFNFLQESQVGPEPPPEPPTAVYVDPAVVSFGSVKSSTEGFVRQRLGVGPADVGPPTPQVGPPPPSQVGPIQTETFVNSTFSSSAPTYSPQTLPVYSTPPSGGIDSGLPPAPIPMPTQPSAQPEKVPPATTFESTSWAAQEEVEGWGASPDPPTAGPLNGGETGETNTWGVTDSDNVETSGWGDDPVEVKPAPQVGGVSHDSLVGEDRRGGYRGCGGRGGGRGRGGMMGGGGFRGGRGGYNSYQGAGRGGNSFGGNSGYGGRGGGRGGSSSNGGGYRGRGGFSRGGRGSEGSSRGMGGPRGRSGYQGNQLSSQRNQY